MGHETHLGSSPASNPWLIDLLRGTLRHLEEDMHLHSDDAALKHVKSSIVRAIAELQMNRQAA